jgi:hypothetical protein
MQTKFVKNLSNIARLLDGVKVLQARGAAEASVLLVKGLVGFGKTDGVQWLAVQNRSLFLTGKKEWTPHWMLGEIARELGIKSRAKTEDMYSPVCEQLIRRMELEPDFCVMIDEFDFVADRARLLDTIRGICDLTKVPLIAVGMQDVDAAIRRNKAFQSRICKTVEFTPATAKDVRALCSAFIPDVKIADSMIELIRHRSGGQLRGIKQAIALVEAHARRNRGEVTADDWGKRALLPDDRDVPKGEGDE